MNKLWVDDIRTPPDSSWHWALDSAEAIDMLRSCFTVYPVDYQLMSLDHDLGGDDTTRSIVLWLCENPEYWPNEVQVHSSNPPGKFWLEEMIKRYHPSNEGYY
jgi:hypothetical protein